MGEKCSGWAPVTRLLMLVEGQTEETFVKRTLTPYLAERGVFVQSPVVLWTRRMPAGGGHRGGACSWAQIRRSLAPLTHDRNAWITTLLDFYGLPEDFPGLADAGELEQSPERVIRAQNGLANAISHPRLIPFLALHEFEAWLFSAPEIVATHFGNPAFAAQLEKIVAQAGSPEAINHGQTTHPKARLRNLPTGYRETTDGPTLAEKIGIPTLRAHCPHFDGWLTRLETLSP